MRSRKQSRSLILAKLCEDFARERTIQRNLEAKLPATHFRGQICSPRDKENTRGDSGVYRRKREKEIYILERRERELETEKQKLEHASAVPFNLRGNIFGVRAG